MDRSICTKCPAHGAGKRADSADLGGQRGEKRQRALWLGQERTVCVSTVVVGCEHRAVGKLGAPITRGTYVSVIRLKLPTSIKSLAPKSRRGARRAGSTAAQAAASWRSSQWRPPTQNPSESAVSSSACCSDASRPILDIRDRPRGARRPRSPKALLRPCAAAVTKTKARRKPNEPSLLIPQGSLPRPRSKSDAPAGSRTRIPALGRLDDNRYTTSAS